MTLRADLLEPSPAQSSPPVIDLTDTNRILRSIFAELRKDVPKQRCIIEVQGGIVVNGVHTVGNGSPPATITFLNEGNPVKSLYTIVVNGTPVIDDFFQTDLISVSINEPNIINNGIYLVWFQQNIILPDVEIQYLSINSAGNNVIPINAPSQDHGSVWVYAWTLPEYSNITE